MGGFPAHRFGEANAPNLPCLEWGA
jgi:hypothetical protein